MAEYQLATLPDTKTLKKEMGIGTGELVTVESKTVQVLDKEADDFVDNLINLSMDKVDDQEIRKLSVENIGMKVQKDAAAKSQMLQRPIKELSTRSEDGGEVANALIDLKMQVEALDPGKFDFGKPGWFTRMVGNLPFIGSTLKRYFSRYEKSQTIINAIINSLKNGKERLTRDNMMLVEDQKAMREMTIRLEKAVKLGQLIDAKLQYKLEREIEPDDPKHKFVSDELIFPLRQRIMDLQQQLAVNQQGVLAIEIIRRNNKELIRGVDRAVNVTVNALQVAVTVALALNNQRIVLDKINAVNITTSNLIASTARQLKEQGADIQKQASESMLSVEALKSAFSDISTAMDEISKYRQDALPKMAQTIIEFDDLLGKGEARIKDLEKGNKTNPAFTLSVDKE
ncbi:MAG: toxic anion resistance protein [Spirochaetales bacterium]|nr:toxic anion resistance protein [Spirochaetales bacterium]